MTSAEDLQLLQGFRDETRELLDATDASFLQLERDPRDSAAINTIFRAFHTIKGNSSFFGLVRVKEFAHGVETALDELRKGAIVATSDLIDTFLAAKDHLARLVDHCDSLDAIPAEREAQLLAILQGNRALATESLVAVQQDLRELVDTLRETSEEVPELAPLIERADRAIAPAKDRAGSPPAAGKEIPRAQEARTIRIDERRLEVFFASVGDLMNFSEIYQNLHRNFEGRGVAPEPLREFKGTNRNFRLLVDRLQKEILELRQVPIGPVLTKVARIARDAARSVDKRIDVVVHGAELPIDKSYLEIVEAPLLHLVRNAVDHGLETTTERAAASKPASGSIRLSFAVHKDHYEFEIADDGRGIDAARVRQKAIQKGIVSAAEAERLDETASVHLILRPGFSTAETVTELSGRGVGLDVVQEAIERCKGRLRIETERGRGTRFVVQLPRSVNLIVLESLLVRVGRMPYLLPLESVRETFDLLPGMAVRMPMGGEVVPLRQETLPLLRAPELLGGDGDEEVAHGVVVHDRRETFVLAVHEALGLQKVVVKQLEDRLLDSPHLRGAAVLGDGSVGLVLDVASFARQLATSGAP